MAVKVSWYFESQYSNFLESKDDRTCYPEGIY